jgi:flagella basal body P-ring formation protein FlgA
MTARIFLALSALVIGAAILLAGPATAQVAVRGEWVTLGDVAPVTGEAAGIALMPSPPAGQKLALDPKFVTSVAKNAGIVIALPLDQPIYVTRAGAGAPPAAPVARQAPKAPVAPQATTIASSAASPQAGLVLVLVRDIARGSVIQSSDLDWQSPPGTKPRGLPEDPALVVGKEAKRALRSGAVLYGTDFQAPNIVRKGESVKIVYAASGIRLTADGVAQGDAAKGETVRVLNNYNKRSIDAVAYGEGEVRVSER